MKNTSEMPFNYSKLRGRMAEKSIPANKLATLIGISNVSMSCKLNNKTAWSQADILKTADILDISKADIGLYFFTI